MRTEATLVADTSEFLALKQADSVRKAEHLHREWHEQVFDKVQTNIDAQIAHRAATSDLGQRWRTAQDEYLVACAPLAEERPGAVEGAEPAASWHGGSLCPGSVPLVA